MYALANRFPGLLTTLPRRSLAALPTPVEQAAQLGRQVGLNDLLVKRDDLTAVLYGGNKVRKLEYLLADAQLLDCDTVLTFGAVGSNHALATSIFARELGLQCIAVLTDQAPTPNVSRTLRHHARLGTRLVHATSYSNSKELSDEIASTHPGGPELVYRITWGGSSWLGTVGFVNAALELVEQMESGLPDVIYVACGTMGTAVGLGLGLSLAGAHTRVEAIQVVPNVVTNPERFQAMHEQTNEQLAARDKSELSYRVSREGLRRNDAGVRRSSSEDCRSRRTAARNNIHGKSAGGTNRRRKRRKTGRPDSDVLEHLQLSAGAG